MHPKRVPGIARGVGQVPPTPSVVDRLRAEPGQAGQGGGEAQRIGVQRDALVIGGELPATVPERGLQAEFESGVPRPGAERVAEYAVRGVRGGLEAALQVTADRDRAGR